ncbi:MAG: hypothetical protein AABO58_26060 [Acidobacteriota bacterium]
MSAGQRTLLGRNTGVAERQTVYESADGLEIESIEQYERSRAMVLFEDVVLVTYHRELGWPMVVLNAALASVFFLIGGLIFAANSSMAVAAIFAAFGIPSLVLIIVRLARQVDVISVFGRRSKAVIRFPYRKRRAREIYGHLCARTRQIQEQIGSENAGYETARAEEPPAPPSGPVLTMP